MSQLLINQYLADQDKLKKLSGEARMAMANVGTLTIAKAMTKAAR